MINFEDYSEQLFEATEATDRKIYEIFLDSKGKRFNLIPQRLKSNYDIMQIGECSRTMIELKTRWKYEYNRFDDISVDLFKIRTMLEIMEDEGANGIYLCVFYPKDDKVILIDITDIRYDESDIVTRYANKTTITDKKLKVPKKFIELDIRNKFDYKKNTRTTIHTFKDLRKTYIDVFLCYCKAYGIPDEIADIAIYKMN